MNSYVFIGTEKDLLDNGFTYRKHYNNYLKGYYKENYKTNQDFNIQIDHISKEVDVYIQCLRSHRNEFIIKEGLYNIQVDLYPVYFKIINSLVEKNIIKEKENE